MHYLARQETEWRRDRAQAAMAESYARGLRDFLLLHVMTWLPRADEYQRAQCPGAWPAHWLALFACFAGRQ